MENVNQQQANPNEDPNALPKKPVTNKEAAEFENPSTDPGFEPSCVEGEVEKKEDEVPEKNDELDNDAMNYKNDRDNGAYNPKVI